MSLLSAVAAVGIGVVVIGRFTPQSWVGRMTGAPQAALSGAPGSDEPPLPPLSIGGKFSLVDPAGRTVTEASFPGKWKLIYFGYTTCPDACPTTLQTMAAALKALGPPADKVVPFFITVDPARDRPDVMGRYVALFDPRMVGLSGTPEQVAGAEKAFHVYAARVDRPGTTTYLMDHTSFVYLLDPGGTLQALFDLDTTAAAMAARLRQALA